MSDLKLNRFGDLDFSSRRLHLVGGANAVAQQIRIRFRTFLGEWFYDRTAGFPWFQQVLGVKGDVQQFEGLFRQVILTTPKVLSIETFSFTFDQRTRVLTVTFRAKTSEGVLDFDDDFDFEESAPEPLTGHSAWNWSSSSSAGSGLFTFVPFSPAPDHYWAQTAILPAGGGHPAPYVADEGVTGGIDFQVGTDQSVGGSLNLTWETADGESRTGTVSDDDIAFFSTEAFTVAAWVRYERSGVGAFIFPLRVGATHLVVKDAVARAYVFYDFEEEFVTSTETDVGTGPSTGFHLYSISVEPGPTGSIVWYIDGTAVHTIDGVDNPQWFTSGLLTVLGAVDGLTAEWGQVGIWRDDPSISHSGLYARGPAKRIKAAP